MTMHATSVEYFLPLVWILAIKTALRAGQWGVGVAGKKGASSIGATTGNATAVSPPVGWRLMRTWGYYLWVLGCTRGLPCPSLGLF